MYVSFTSFLYYLSTTAAINRVNQIDEGTFTTHSTVALHGDIFMSVLPNERCIHGQRARGSLKGIFN